MRKSLCAIACVLALGGCENQPSVDCTKLDMDKLNRCWEQNGTKGWATGLVACMPFSEVISTEGFWVVGFEKNDFFEGRHLPPDDVLWSDSTGAELIVDEKIFKPSNTPQALEVSVVGRRALCPVGVLNPYPIAVEQIRIKRRIKHP